MWKFLTLFSENLLKGSVRSMLAGAGLGLGSSAVSLTLIQSYISDLVAKGNSMASDALGLLALSGAHIALSSILGAIVYKLTVSSVKLTLMRKK
ncbi:DUF2523 family protein [Acinetobacter sp. MD2(2019)]|uniref:DUF2523 family protein n=1 Tax=Acinetobacter sp. MD2(2019) TaxID=2605273 RepID=UPI002D1F132F|nr:DUF2523 family protein [Acinetobacter sp. MD2(2019)]MEB3755191.1 DUF2523 domain-containing protein [Acinetobacter sp. MD2(2019)]